MNRHYQMLANALALAGSISGLANPYTRINMKPRGNARYAPCTVCGKKTRTGVCGACQKRIKAAEEQAS